GISFTTIIMPVLLLVLGTFAPFLPLPGDAVGILEFIGSPLVALLLSCFFAFYFLGFRQGLDKKQIKKYVEECFLPVGSII
ncbi:2-keto-3-deoxygluconate permease, partial [Planococcus sp. SIMBA_143]